MKNLLFLLLLMTSVAIVNTSCNEDDETTTTDSSLPTGKFTAQRSGTLVAQNGTPTKGAAEVGTDEDGEQFVRFGSDFMTELGTGTVTVYLSKGQTLMFDPGKGNPNVRIVGLVGKNGELFLKVNTTAGSEFTHVVLWCGSAAIPFGYAPLK